ncbi:hypothetical protein GIX82_03500 [Lactobacillus reuteri]|uniref:Uncharacterized protein n=2 Tax=Limosilactobacillus caviae TaxID=1769424 RepID=A0ABQ2C4J7_9LACO|nr:hypothetical protein [Limosilactobacillus reuteri]GGI62965.1 hypothetical protein GCM10011459_07990 [Limosilactobacillus caviae]
MFCNFDYYNLGLARYEFEMRCTNKLELKFGDKRTIIIFNATAKEFSKSDILIKSFLALMNNQVDNKSKFIRQIQTEIANIKENPERRRGYMKFQTLLADAKYEEREKAIAILVKSLRDVKVSDEDIKAKLKENYDLSDKEADKYLQ